jgi:hypothetical protein
LGSVSEEEDFMKLSGTWGGLLLVADGMAGLIWPSRYLRLLEIGPSPIKKTFEAFAERPRLTRSACLIEVGIGIWMIARSV